MIKLVNMFYQQWLLTNDPYIEDFESLISEFGNFGWNEGTQEWILI